MREEACGRRWKSDVVGLKWTRHARLAERHGKAWRQWERRRVGRREGKGAEAGEK